MPKTTNGFSLLEVLITLAIIALLSIFYLPSYRSTIAKAHRTDGQIALMKLANQLENYYYQNHHSYRNANLEKLSVAPLSAQGFYQLKIMELAKNHYTIAATPKQNDPTCGELLFDSNGKKYQSGQGTTQICWS